MRKMYRFDLTLYGYGETPEEALEDIKNEGIWHVELDKTKHTIEEEGDPCDSDEFWDVDEDE